VYHAASGGLKTASFYNDGVGLSLHPERLKLAFTILSSDRPARRR
jgi:hypothetical protein